MGLLESIAGILILLWLLGLIFHVGGGLIHILLVIGIILFIMRMMRKSV